MKPYTMKNVSNKKISDRGAVRMNVYPPPIPLIKGNNCEKSDKDCVKIKLGGYPTSEKLDIYEFKMIFLTTASQRSFLLYVQYFQRTLEAS